MERKKILWLVSWYPNKYDQFDGDFIQRHANTAALNNDIYLIFVKAIDETLKAERTVNKANGLTEEIIYFKKRKGFIGKVRNQFIWRSFYKKAVADYCKNGLPQFVHVHVPWKAGLIALWTKRKYKTPYLVTEHWGIYNDVVKDNIHTKPFFVRRGLRRIYEKATSFISVSQFLGEAVNKTILQKEYSVIPNVVDTDLFFPIQNKSEIFTFLHVSNMVTLKNVEGILSAFNQFLRQTKEEARLVLAGPNFEHYQRMSQNFSSASSIIFTGELLYPEVANQMQSAHTFILNSQIENSPCVIGEALCCGLPVIATNVGGIPELVSKQNGILIPANNTEALCEAMVEMYWNHNDYTSQEIAKQASMKFSIQSVSSQFQRLYSV